MCVFKGVVKKKNRGLGLPRGARSLCVSPTGYRLRVLVGLFLRKDDQDGARCCHRMAVFRVGG